MAKTVGTFIKILPSDIQKKAKGILVFCENNVVHVRSKKT